MTDTTQSDTTDTTDSSPTDSSPTDSSPTDSRPQQAGGLIPSDPVETAPTDGGPATGPSTGTTGTTGTTDADASSAAKDPSDWVTGDEVMTGPQKSYLGTLAREAGEQLPDTLTKAEASEHIDRLQSKTGRGA